jgi:spoIIIJ-associated protein
MTTVEFAGQDLAEAIAAAAGALNLPPEKLKFSVLEMGTKGFLGLGRRRARIAVDPADPTLYPSEEDEPAPAPAAEAALTPETPAAPAALPPAVPAAPSRPRKPAPAAGAKPGPEPLPGSGSRPLPLLETPPLTRPAAGETRVDNPDDETARLARTVVADILGRLGLAADLTLVRLGSRLVVNLDGPDRALLIGARGVTLDALQLLVAKIMAKKNPGEDGRLVLDVADYRFRRHNQVMEERRLQAETARRTGRPQTLTGLNAAERRMIHLALRPVKDIELKAGRGRESLVLEPARGQPDATGAGPRRRKKIKGPPK